MAFGLPHSQPQLADAADADHCHDQSPADRRDQKCYAQRQRPGVAEVTNAHIARILKDEHDKEHQQQ